MHRHILLRTVLPAALAISACQLSSTIQAAEPTSEPRSKELVPVPDGVQYLEVSVVTDFGDRLFRNVPVRATVFCSSEDGGVSTEVSFDVKSNVQGVAVFPRFWLACDEEPWFDVDVSVLGEPLRTGDRRKLCSAPEEGLRIIEGDHITSNWHTRLSYCQDRSRDKSRDIAAFGRGIERGK